MNINLINTNNKQLKPAFSANILVCKTKTITRCLEKAVEVSGGYSPDFVIEEARYAKNIGTKGMYDCNAGGITGGDTHNNFLFHLVPCDFMNDLRENLIKVNYEFGRAVKKLNFEGKTAEGLIWGGDYGRTQSKELTIVLKYFFEKFNITPTIFAGTRRGKNILYHGKSNTWLASVNGINSREEVIDSFNYVNVSRNDKVKFVDSMWMNTMNKGLNKGKLDLTIEEVLKNYQVSPKFLKSL